MRMKKSTSRKLLGALTLILILAFRAPNLYSYSVLTHEAVVDSLWTDTIEPMLRQRFPALSARDLKTAHAYAYGGSIIQDAGYYPFGSHFFTDLVHYVRSGDFVAAMLHNARNADEYAFALGALAHYASDNTGHPLGINRAVPLLYPKLRRKYGNEVTYADSPGAHLKTEFAFDVLEVGKGRYASDAYRDFIGFEVSKPVLEAAFRETYGLELEDVFDTLDLGIGTYRKTVSSVIPKMTQIAWQIKKDEIQKSVPGVTRAKFVYNIRKADYQKAWGKEYREPGFGSRLLVFIIRIVPKIGPLRVLQFRTPTPEAERVFLAGFNATVERYRALLAAERSRGADPADLNLDLGKPTTAGMYKISDEAYAKLVHELAKRQFVSMPRPLRENMLAFYKDLNAPIATKKHRKEWETLQRELEMLKKSGD
jgi:Zinc dependent phospholipase C